MESLSFWFAFPLWLRRLNIASCICWPFGLLLLRTVQFICLFINWAGCSYVFNLLFSFLPICGLSLHSGNCLLCCAEASYRPICQVLFFIAEQLECYSERYCLYLQCLQHLLLVVSKFQISHEHLWSILNWVLYREREWGLSSVFSFLGTFVKKWIATVVWVFLGLPFCFTGLLICFCDSTRLFCCCGSVR
jgi:hypothetical protein